MNIFKGLQAASLVSLVALGVSFAAACTDDPGTPGAEDAGPDATPAVDGGADATDAAVDPCAFGEPNDTRETATAIDLNKTYAGLCVSNPDPVPGGPSGDDELDFFEITAPATDLAGGYVELSMANVSTSGLAEFIVTSTVDNQVVLDQYTADLGGSAAGWFTVTPGAKYIIQVNRFGGHGDRFSYDLLAEYTAIVDSFEPNNTKETAKPLALGATISASAAWNDAKATLQPGDDEDWYTVTLADGAATVKMTNVPAGYNCDVILLTPAGETADQGENYSTTPGADCTVSVAAVTAGTYWVKIAPFDAILRADKDAPPAYVTGHYSLEVTQP